MHWKRAPHALSTSNIQLEFLGGESLSTVIGHYGTAVVY